MSETTDLPAFRLSGALPSGVTVLEASAGTGKTFTIAALSARYVAEGTPLVMLATFDPHDSESVQRYERVLHLMRDMRRQGAQVLAIANAGDHEVAGIATDTITIKPAREPLMTMAEVIPLQLLAYEIAVLCGCWGRLRDRRCFKR